MRPPSRRRRLARQIRCLSLGISEVVLVYKQCHTAAILSQLLVAVSSLGNIDSSFPTRESLDGLGWRSQRILTPQMYDDFTNYNFEEPLRYRRESRDDKNKPTRDERGPSTQCRFPRLRTVLTSPPLSYSDELSFDIMDHLESSGFVNDNDVGNFGRGFSLRQEELSTILIRDFEWRALDAHRARVGIIELVHRTLDEPQMPQIPQKHDDSARLSNIDKSRMEPTIFLPARPGSTSTTGTAHSPDTTKLASWKSVLVNDKAKLRRSREKVGRGAPDGKDIYNYGLSKSMTNDGDRSRYRTLFAELDNFWTYMTVPQTSVLAEAPIRERTAEVYQTHARLFLGWVLDSHGVLVQEDLFSMIIPFQIEEELIKKEISRLDVEGSQSKLSLPSMAGDSTRNRVAMWHRVVARQQSSSIDTNLPAIELRETLERNLSLLDVFPDTSADSASFVLEYILWLRSQRSISSNYEANILRGLIKLVKFRFASELKDSTQHNSMTKNKSSLDYLPIIIELRRLHRDAGHKAKKSQRSSDEGKKWLEWYEYLEVIELLKFDLSTMLKRFQVNSSQKNDCNGVVVVVSSNASSENKILVQKKEIAVVFQHYLILSFFASVPDRQRTFRELELGRNFFRVDSVKSNNDVRDSNADGAGIWVIKHTADDYKTGSTYGERPPLPLPAYLTPFIEDFLERWRPSLVSKSNPSSTSFFLQPRTGNAMTPNSVYQIVSRNCYKYKQRKTNPHLLRDMIVTHVRKNSDASEKELEALALFMGHSIGMQRESYDRRTLEQKIEPAVQMMQIVNTMGDYS